MSITIIKNIFDNLYSIIIKLNMLSINNPCSDLPVGNGNFINMEIIDF